METKRRRKKKKKMGMEMGRVVADGRRKNKRRTVRTAKMGGMEEVVGGRKERNDVAMMEAVMNKWTKFHNCLMTMKTMMKKRAMIPMTTTMRRKTWGAAAVNDKAVVRANVGKEKRKGRKRKRKRRKRKRKKMHRIILSLVQAGTKWAVITMMMRTRKWNEHEI
jgi:hypothetical protein